MEVVDGIGDPPRTRTLNPEIKSAVAGELTSTHQHLKASTESDKE
jgi:hypothetical protein